MGILIPTVRTICTDLQFVKSLINNWQQLFNEVPSKETIGIIYAQHYVETGNLNSWNWNCCNIKYLNNPNDQIEYCVLKGVFEYVNGVRVEVSSENPSSWFRSFNTLDDGVNFYLQFVSGKRYKSAWDAARQGNLASFVHLLRANGYFTAPENTYLQFMMGFYNKFMKLGLYEQAFDNTPVVNNFKNFADSFKGLFK